MVYNKLVFTETDTDSCSAVPDITSDFAMLTNNKANKKYMISKQLKKV